MNNDYPIKVIDDEILDFLNKKYKKDIAQKDKKDDKKIIYLVLPYLNRKVEVFGLDLENLVKKFYNDVKLEVVFHTANDIGRCFPFKDGQPKHMQSCVVYHLKCSNCNADYIGKTSRQVKRRFEEHKSG